MKKSIFLITFLLVGFFGMAQNERPYIIKYKTQGDTIYHRTQSVSGIHIDAQGQKLIHENGTEWSSLTDLDTVYIYRGNPTGDWVDLGLPSGLLWATRNVGASSPEDYGDYFAWAETQPKSYYDWSTYQYTCNDSWDGMTKYCTNSYYGCNGFTDYLGILQPGDDAATANWGSGARMPTSQEWEELQDYCSSVWTTQNGVNGRRFTGPNGNTLFLPAAGCRLDDELYSAGSYGSYWSSWLGPSYPDLASYFYFYWDSTRMNSNYRDYGRSVRAVREY